jgi:penicillin-binding protein 1A
VAFTPDVVTGVWVGNDDNTTMPGMTGGSLPASIWRSFMSPYMASRPVKNFDLAYSKPLKDADFVTYNIKNLSTHDSSKGLSSGEMQQGEIQQDPILDPLIETNSQTAPPEPATEGEFGRAGFEPKQSETMMRPVVPPLPPPDTQPPLQQPMPGYDNISSPRNTENKVGYGVIPIERVRRRPEFPETGGGAESYGASPVPYPEVQETNRRRY